HREIAQNRAAEPQILRVPATNSRRILHRVLLNVLHSQECGRRARVRTARNKFSPPVRRRLRRAHTRIDMERFTERSARIADAVDHTTVDAARAIHALPDTDLIRLKALARLWSRGLPGGIGWTDVLNEA